MYSEGIQSKPAVRGTLPTFQSKIQASQGPLLGTILTISSPLIAGLAARMFDFVMIDMEHSPLSMDAVTTMVHTIANVSSGACIALIRVPSHGVEWAKWALDSGAAGIIIPMVNSANQMEQIIQNCLYPPRGARSFGPFNAPLAMQGSATSFLAGFSDYYDVAQQRSIAILPMIESADGVKNAEAIMNVDGVSGVFIGPYDLRLSLELPGGIDGPEDTFTTALKKICKLGKQLGLCVGSMGVGSEIARKRSEIGMDFLLVGVDYGVLLSGFAKDKEAAQKGVDLFKGTR